MPSGRALSRINQHRLVVQRQHRVQLCRAKGDGQAVVPFRQGGGHPLLPVQQGVLQRSSLLSGTASVALASRGITLRSAASQLADAQAKAPSQFDNSRASRRVALAR